MQVTVDADLCQGHGVCESEAPGVFEVGDNDRVIILDPAPAEDRRGEVEAAIRYCPTSALRLTEKE